MARSPDSPLISVIIPCFNGASFLPDCFGSLQAQTYPHWEAIIVDDGSTDDTEAVACGYVERDSRFKYFKQENRGLSNARNRGLLEASGAYVQFLDCDDAVKPAKLELQLKPLQACDGLAVAYCDFVRSAEDDITKELSFDQFLKPRFTMARPVEDIAARWETEFSIPVHCFLFDARLFREHGIHFDERLPNHEDWDCWMRVFALNPRVIHVPGELAVYRHHPTAMSRNLKRMRNGFLMAIDKQLALCENDPGLRRILERKREEMNAVYAKRLWAQRIGLSWWKRSLPWPIQRFIARVWDGCVATWSLMASRNPRPKR